MARSRNIKPGFFKNEILAEMPPETRLLFMGLWCLADREGRFEDRPKKIKMELFPCDDFSIEESLSALAGGGFLIRYEVDGNKYAQVVNFTKHQMPHHKEVASEIPAPPGFKQVTKHTYDVTPQDRLAVFKRDGDKCLKCGSVDDLSLDHITPLASGGDNSINNLQTLCKRCNSSKGNSIKDHRKSNVDPTLNQRKSNDGASCPSDSWIPDSRSLTADSLNLIPDSSSQPVVTKTDSAISKTLNDDDQPKDPAEWIAVFSEQHGVDVDHRNFHDRKKFWPLAKAWTNAGVTVGQMRAACRKANADATEPISWLPAYADRVLASMTRRECQQAQAESFRERDDRLARERIESICPSIAAKAPRHRNVIDITPTSQTVFGAIA